MSSPLPRRPAWIEIDLGVLARNFRRLRAELPPAGQLLFVAKDNAYGLGAVAASRVAVREGVEFLAVYTLGEAQELREAGIQARILLLGERLPEEVPAVVELNLEPCVGQLEQASYFADAGRHRGRPVPVHLKINTGMNRFGLPWRRAAEWSRELAGWEGLEFAGVLSHFAQSDEADKTFARVQLSRFEDALAQLRASGIRPRLIHHCNSGGFLDLPEAHFDVVRVGLLAQGVFPSQACRRLAGLETVLSLKARLVAFQDLEPGDTVGYGMRWRADRPSRIGLVPLGYGDGYPRLRNAGEVLIQGRRVPLVGGVTMDALMVDLTDLPGVRLGDEVVLLGRQGSAEITAHELAAWKGSVSYDILTGWRARLPRVYRE